MTTTLQLLDGVLEGLMRRYRERVPDVGLVVGAMVQDGLVPDAEHIENDHIAFRTMGSAQLGIRSLEKIFLHLGYVRRDHLHFVEKKLNAFWYSPPKERYPRVFISELQIEKLSAEAQVIIRRYADQIPHDPVDALDLNDAAAVDSFLHRPLWNTPSWGEYQRLLAESEYAAWVMYNRYYLNHFTVSVHSLPKPYNAIEAFNDFLERHGIVLNTSGGKIKVSPDGLLRQSSTVAQLVNAEFPGERGTEVHAIAGSYVEFAERRVLPQYAALGAAELKREHRRDGFESANADRIFESTYTSQTKLRARE